MPYLKVMFSYACPAGHRNQITKFYRAETCEEAEKRYPHMLPCAFCPPNTILMGSGDVEFDCREISDFDFSESGGTIEPDVS